MVNEVQVNGTVVELGLPVARDPAPSEQTGGDREQAGLQFLGARSRVRIELVRTAPSAVVVRLQPTVADGPDGPIEPPSAA